MNEIWKWVLGHNPHLMIIALAAFSGWWASHWMHRIRKIEETCKSLDETCKKLEGRIERIEDKIDLLIKAVHGIIVYLKSKDAEFDASYFKINSPIMLTNVGDQVLREVGGKQLH
jgi:hypothetical protein